MIHIATVHYQSQRWIDIQLKFLKKNVGMPFRTYVFLDGISKSEDHKFDNVYRNPVLDHGAKLNFLAEQITLQAQPSDIMLFIDGDAFPIKKIPGTYFELNRNWSLIAVQRIENYNDKKPHPCFCITNVKFWNTINGDWNKGDGDVFQRYSNNAIDIDPGVRLLKQLNEKKWLKLRRTESLGTHTILFGVYDNFLYHHGCGFRDKFTSVERQKIIKLHNRIILRFIRLFGKRISERLWKILINENKLLIEENKVLSYVLRSYLQN